MTYYAVQMGLIRMRKDRPIEFSLRYINVEVYRKEEDAFRYVSERAPPQWLKIHGGSDSVPTIAHNPDRDHNAWYPAMWVKISEDKPGKMDGRDAKSVIAEAQRKIREGRG